MTLSELFIWSQNYFPKSAFFLKLCNHLEITSNYLLSMTLTSYKEKEVEIGFLFTATLEYFSSHAS